MVAVPRIFAEPRWSEKRWRKEIRRCENKRLYERLLAINYSTRGKDAPTIADLLGRNTQTIYNWIKRWNEEGKKGLLDRPRSGKPGYMTKEQRADLYKVLTTQRPCDVMPKESDAIAWDIQLMREFIKHRYDVEYDYKATWHIARRVFKLNYIRPRQVDYRKPADAEQILKKVLAPPSNC